MNWLFFALLNPAIYTIVNFTDKYVIERAVPDTRGVPIFLAVVQGTVATVLWAANGFPILAFDIAAPLMLTGAFVTVGTFLLFAALSREETSKIVVWTQMLPVFVLAFSVIVLDEVLTPAQLIGFVLILAAAVGLSLRREAGALEFSPSFWFMLGAVSVWAASDILLKLILNNQPSLEATSGDRVNARAFITIVSYQSWGFALAGLMFYLLLADVRKAFNYQLRHARKTAFVVLYVNESIFVLRQFVRAMAIALGPLAMVSVLDSTRIFLSIAVGGLLTVMAPAIFSENITREGLTRKLAFSGLLFAGLVFVFLFGVE